MPRTRRPLLLALSLLASGCVQTTTLALAPPPPAGAIRVSRAVRAWNWMTGEQIAGSVVLFRDLEGDSFYSIRNEFQQELGVIDAQGIAYKYLPHQEEAERVGTGSVAEGARLILNMSQGQLEETGLSTIRDASRCSGTWNAANPAEENQDAEAAH